MLAVLNNSIFITCWNTFSCCCFFFFSYVTGFRGKQGGLFVKDFAGDFFQCRYLLSLSEHLMLLFLTSKHKMIIWPVACYNKRALDRISPAALSGAAASLLTSLPRVANCVSVQPNCQTAPLCHLARSRSPRLDTPHSRNAGWDACKSRPWRCPHLHPLQVSWLITVMNAKEDVDILFPR